MTKINKDFLKIYFIKHYFTLFQKQPHEKDASTLSIKFIEPSERIA